MTENTHVNDHTLILRADAVNQLDYFACDMKAFVTDRIESFLQSRHFLPTAIEVSDSGTQHVQFVRRMEIEALFLEITSAMP